MEWYARSANIFSCSIGRMRRMLMSYMMGWSRRAKSYAGAKSSPRLHWMIESIFATAVGAPSSPIGSPGFFKNRSRAS